MGICAMLDGLLWFLPFGPVCRPIFMDGGWLKTWRNDEGKCLYFALKFWHDSKQNNWKDFVGLKKVKNLKTDGLQFMYNMYMHTCRYIRPYLGRMFVPLCPCLCMCKHTVQNRKQFRRSNLCTFALFHILYSSCMEARTYNSKISGNKS